MISKMKINNLINISVIAGLIFAIFSMILSDLHTVSDIFINVNKSYMNIQYPIFITAAIIGPILVLSTFFYSAGFIAIYKYNKNKISKYIGFTLIISAITQILLCVADFNYATVIKLNNLNSDQYLIQFAGGLRGLSTLLIALTEGIAFPIITLVYFKNICNITGFSGSIMVIITVILGVIIKTIALFAAPILLLSLFLIIMGLKSMGIVFISKGLYDQKIRLTTAST